MSASVTHLESFVERCHLAPSELSNPRVLCRQGAQNQADDIGSEELHPSQGRRRGIVCLRKKQQNEDWVIQQIAPRWVRHNVQGQVPPVGELQACLQNTRWLKTLQGFERVGRNHVWSS